MVKRILLLSCLALAPSTAIAAEVDEPAPIAAAEEESAPEGEQAVEGEEDAEKEGEAPTASAAEPEEGLAPEVAEASESAAAAAPEPLVVHHAARSGAAPNEAMRIEVTVEGEAEVVIWVNGKAADVIHTATRHFTTIDAEAMVPPGIGYAIEVRRGDAVWRFASREHPHRVQVIDGGDDPHGRDLDAEAQGRTVALYAQFRYGSFGTAGASVIDADTGAARRIRVDDYLWQLETGAAYRWHGAVHEVGLFARVARGRSPSSEISDDDPSAHDVALDAGAAQLAFRLAPGLYGGPWLLLGHRDGDFAWGGGGTLRLGEPYGSRVEIRGGLIAGWGAEASVSTALVPVEWLSLGATADLTGAPHGEALGVGFTGDLALSPGAGFVISGRAGYQTRGGRRGGPIVGGGLGYAF